MIRIENGKIGVSITDAMALADKYGITDEERVKLVDLAKAARQPSWCTSPLLGPGSFGHPGRGGALGLADPETGVAFGYVTNGFGRAVTADPRAQALVRAVRNVVLP